MSTRFTLISWNVLEGFHRPGTAEIDRLRLSAARRFLAHARPDVLVVNEALWCEPHGGRFVDYADLLGFPHSACALYDGHWGNAILSRLPLGPATRFHIHNRGGIAARPGNGPTVATYHPHPGRLPASKAADFISLVTSLEGPVALCGDFNAVHPGDLPDVSFLERGFARFSRNPAADVARFVEGGRAVFRALADAGLRDGIPHVGRYYTIPTDMLSSDKSSAMRLDHIMVNPYVTVHSATVAIHPDAEMASDHRPVMANLSCNI